MTVYEAIEIYLEKKKLAELTKSEIKELLLNKHQFSNEETTVILRAISTQELNELENERKGINKLFDSIYFSYFFILFGLIAIIVSLYFIWLGNGFELSRFLPWLILVGGIFILIKHILRVNALYSIKKEKL